MTDEIQQALDGMMQDAAAAAILADAYRASRKRERVLWEALDRAKTNMPYCPGCGYPVRGPYTEHAADCFVVAALAQTIETPCP